ncbi:Ankyrin repeat domain-containing protein 50 [Phytophthora ramorum]|nr:Ankyrin repeat domain-containing protein 50 [Phytophthora ramorum]
MDAATQRELDRALGSGDADAFRRLYEQHPQYRDEAGRTLLHLAIQHNLFEAIEGDISLAIVGARDKHGRTPLMVAAERGFSLICEELLTIGASTSAVASDRSTALTIALRNDRLLVCQVLVAVDPEQAMHQLLQAINRDARDEVVLLVKAGVSLDISRTTGGEERNPLREAISHPLILRELLRFGAPVNTKNKAGATALSFAAATGHLKACEILLDYGASLNSKDNEGQTPMYHACCHERENSIAHFVQQLGVTVDTMNNKGRTPLFYHAERGNVLGCELLLRYHANATHRDMSAWTALHLAASHGHKEVCRLLLGYVNVTTVEREDQQMVLCQPTSSVGSWISVTETVLMRIYAKLMSSGVQATLRKYGTLRIRDCSMNTLLHVAASSAGDKHCYYIIRCLHLIGNIAINTQNCYCETPLDVAADRQCSMASSALQSLGAVQISSESEIFPSVIELVAPRKGPLSRTVVGSSKDFTSCLRDHIVQLCRGIQDGIYSLTDDTIAQVDTDRGDTVLHYFLQSFVQRTSFPSVEEQREVLSSQKWLGTTEAPRLLRILISKPNWEGKTPLHIAAEVGALGFCEILIEKGASPSEECQAPDNRLLDQSTENPQFWKAINFAAAVRTSLDEAQASFEERSTLVEYLLKGTDSLPNEENAAHDCKEKIQMYFPLLLPLFIRVEDETSHKEDYAEAEELFYKFLDECYPRFQESTVYENDPSGVSVHNIFLGTARHGIKSLKKVVPPQCVIETTGDSLLHLIAVHGHPDFAGIIKFLIDEGQIDINKTNKQLKTALHVAVEHDMTDICLFLIAHGADVTASCQNLETPSKEVWHTPLYTALWSPTPKYEIIEILLSTPQSIAKPRNPKLSRSARYEPGQGPDTKWNGVVLEQLLKIHAAALPLFLDHYAVEVNRINGEKVYRFVEVFEICDHLEQIVNPTGTLTPSLSSKKTIKNSAVTHPVVRNAIHLKWELFGSTTHRKQLSLYVLMVTFFYLSNLLLPKIEVVTNENGKREESTHKWIEFDSVVDYFVGVTKVCCWGLAVYHLLYVEFFKEWRSNPKQYWRSVWNFLDVFTYVLMLGTIPFEVVNGHDTQRECMLSLLSILLCVNLMQALLVSSYFSVLIFTFARMFKVVARFLFQYLLLLLGFSGGLFLLYHGAGPYTDFFSAMRIVFLTTFGELNYGDNYSFDDRLRARNYLAFLLLTAYVLVVIVVAMNLLIALMTSEYEKVRAQAKELSLLELAGALHRYEQWIGYSVVRKLYTTPKGQELINDCVLHVSGSAQQRRNFNRRGLTSSMSTSFSDSMAVPTGRFDVLGTQRSKIDAMHFSLLSKTNASVDGAEMATITEAITTQVMKHVHEEVEALRMQVTTELQDVRELLETAHNGSAQAQKDVASKLSDVLKLLVAKDEKSPRSRQ